MSDANRTIGEGSETGSMQGLAAPRFPPCRSRAELEANLAEVRGRIAAAAKRAGRRPESVRLLPVTKTMGAEVIGWLADTGIGLVGENKVQEARGKAELFDALDLGWAMIGHLQSNKVNQVVGSALEVHSLDRLGLANKIDRRLRETGGTLDVFIQVNSSGEPSKYGLAPGAVPAFADQISELRCLRVRGLMTLAVFSDEVDRVRSCFETMVEVRETLRERAGDPMSYPELSMGMSGDYELAISLGATTVRLGQALFGARDLGPEYYWPGVAAPQV